MIKKLINKLKEAKINKNILKDEAKLLENTDRYNFFGYFIDETKELPMFLSEGEAIGENGRICQSIHPSTPKMLEHCVKHLTEKAKLEEAKNIEAFKKKCGKLAKNAIYQKENWDVMIFDLAKYLHDFKEIKQHEAVVLAKNEFYEDFDYATSDDYYPMFFTKDVINGHYGIKNYQNAIATPKILKHCVEHLTDEAKKTEARCIEYFKDKCYDIAKDSMYQEESWEDVIKGLVKYLKGYNKNTEKSV